MITPYGDTATMLPNQQRTFWLLVGRSVRGFGRAFAIKKWGAEIVKRYQSNNPPKVRK